LNLENQALEQLDEKEIYDPKLAQEIFLLKHREEFTRKAEERLVPKVLKDIDWILRERCAQEISEYDFNHVHLCNLSQDPIFDFDILFSDENVRLLYHTCEKMFAMPYFAKRNIKSSLVSQPEVIPIEYKELFNNVWRTYRFSKTGIFSKDLNWLEYGKIEFEKNPKGHYKLKDGTSLDMIGILYTYPINHAKLVRKI
jgi:hypothetical protein